MIVGGVYHSKGERLFYLLPANRGAAFDLRRPGGRATPYVSGGRGALWSRQLTGAGYYSSATTTWSVGARIFLTDRLFLAPEARFGIEPLIRVSAA